MFIDDDSRSLLFDLCSFRFERSMKIMAIISIIIYATAIFCRFSYGHPNYNKVKQNFSQFLLSAFSFFFLSCIESSDPIDHKMHTFYETKKSLSTRLLHGLVSLSFACSFILSFIRGHVQRAHGTFRFSFS